MRAWIFAAVVTSVAPAWAQSLDGSINATIFGGITSGFQGSLSGGIDSGLGSRQVSRTAAILSADGFASTLNAGDAYTRQALERQGVSFDDCAPTQISVNRSGCRPIRDLATMTKSTYDTSLEAMRPLGGLTLSGQTLSPQAGPAGPLD